MSESKTKTVIPGRRQGPLPAPGHARNEELKRRDDDLQELQHEVETQLQADGVIDVGPGIKPSDLKPENEILQYRDLLTVTNAQEGYRYAWPNGFSQHGIQVTTLQTLGYEMVRGDMPECAERRDELGRRRIGDVLLMRIPLDRYVLLQERNARVKDARKRAVGSKFIEMGEAYRGTGIVTRHASPAELHREATNQLARQMAVDMLKNGA